MTGDQYGGSLRCRGIFAYPPHQIVGKARKRSFERLGALTRRAISVEVCAMGPTAIVLESTILISESVPCRVAKCKT